MNKKVIEYIKKNVLMSSTVCEMHHMSVKDERNYGCEEEVVEKYELDYESYYKDTKTGITYNAYDDMIRDVERIVEREELEA